MPVLPGIVMCLATQAERKLSHSLTGSTWLQYEDHTVYA